MEVKTLRKLLFTPCESQEALRDWVRVFLGIYLPDCTVSDESNSNPTELVWTVYKALKENSGEWSRIMAFANRGGGKTLAASILEVLTVLHLKRNVAHMAAIFEQSKKSQEYVRNFFNRPHIRDFKTGDNTKKLEICRYYNKNSGESLTEKEWEQLPSATERLAHDRINNYIQIVICTMQGANCIDPGTKIEMADGGFRAAAELSAGDLVKSWDTSAHQWVHNKVAGIGITQKQTCRLTFKDGRSVVLSEDHPVFTAKGWKRARTLKLHDKFWIHEQKPNSNPEEFLSPILNLPPWNPYQVLLGTLLGDASLSWPASKGKKYGRGPRLFLFHCDKQTPLLGKVAEALDSLEIPYRLEKHRAGWRVCSGVSEKFVPLYEKLYGSGTKQITPKILEELDIQGLAMWFMDDGSGNPEIIGSKKDRRMSIATCCFGESGNRLIVDWFKNKWGIDAKISWVKKYPVVELTLEGSRKLSQLLFEIVDPCVRYKLLPPSEFLDDFCVETGEKFFRNNRGKGFGRLVSRISETFRGHAKRWAAFSAKHEEGLEKIEFLGPRILCDIVLDAPATSQNFVANSLILLHNSAHVELFCMDELDVVPKQNVVAYKQASAIPDSREGLLPITLLTSTRKSRVGLVQKEIDMAAETGLQIFHWNIIDTTEACPPSRHQPTLPKVKLYVNDELVRHISEDDYKLLNSTEAAKYYALEGFGGCVKCPIFAACKGRLATHQKSASPMLKPIADIAARFKASSPEFLTTEYLCRKPDSTGLIFPRFNRELHMKTPEQIAEMVAGEPQPHVKDKASLIRFMIDKGVQFVGGMDFGFGHNFAVVVFGVWGDRAFILEVLAIPGLELDDKITHSEPLRIAYNNPTFYGDTEAPADIKTFKRRGFRMKEWDKYKGSVKAGIEVIRMMLWPTSGIPKLYLLADDPGCELLATRIENYHFAIDASGMPTEEPVKEADDEIDSMRYGIMNYFAPRGLLKTSMVPAPQETPTAHSLTNNVSNSPHSDWMRDIIKKHTEDGDGTAVDDQTTQRVKKGRFFFDS